MDDADSALGSLLLQPVMTADATAVISTMFFIFILLYFT